MRFRIMQSAVTTVCAMMVAGCAYLNTFYNAQTAYRLARSAHRKLEKHRPDTTVSLTQEILSGYDTAVAKSLRILQEFPKQKRWHDDALLLAGKASFYSGSPSRAIRRLSRLIEEYPTSPLIAEAYLYLGKAYLEDGNLARAEEVLSLVLAKFPQVNRSQEVSILLSRIAVRQGSRALAIELLEKALSGTKDELQKIQLLLRIAKLYVEMGSFDKAVALLESCPRKADAAEMLVQVDLMLVSCYIETQAFSRAAAKIDAMLNNRAYFRHTLPIILKKASLFSALDSVNAAIALYETITDKYGTDSVAAAAWYELGVLYQKRRGDFEKARACYERAVVLLADPRLSKDARSRLEAIDSLMSRWHAAGTAARRSNAVGKGDTAAASTSTDYAAEAFRVGEIFWLLLDEPDSALKYYVGVASRRSDSTFADSSAKALYAAGWITLNLKKDSIGADSIFSELLATYPSSQYAKEAQRARGWKVTVQTREDSACSAFIVVERQFVQDGNAALAADGYLAVHDRFADTEYGVRGLYAAAWLYDVVLEKNKTAYDLYMRLCSEHAASALCLQEAQPRLRVVSDTMRVRQATARSRERTAAGSQSDSVLAPPKRSAPPDRVGPEEREKREASQVAPPAAAPPHGDQTLPPGGNERYNIISPNNQQSKNGKADDAKLNGNHFKPDPPVLP